MRGAAEDRGAGVSKFREQQLVKTIRASVVLKGPKCDLSWRMKTGGPVM